MSEKSFCGFRFSKHNSTCDSEVVRRQIAAGRKSGEHVVFITVNDQVQGMTTTMGWDVNVLVQASRFKNIPEHIQAL